MKKGWMEKLGIMLLLCLVALFCLAFNPSESLMKKSQNQNKSSSPEPQAELSVLYILLPCWVCASYPTQGPKVSLG